MFCAFEAPQSRDGLPLSCAGFLNAKFKIQNAEFRMQNYFNYSLLSTLSLFLISPFKFGDD